MIGLKRGIVKLSPYSPKWVKLLLARQFSTDRRAYTVGKASFIENILYQEEEKATTSKKNFKSTDIQKRT